MSAGSRDPIIVNWPCREIALLLPTLGYIRGSGVEIDGGSKDFYYLVFIFGMDLGYDEFTKFIENREREGTCKKYKQYLIKMEKAIVYKNKFLILF